MTLWTTQVQAATEVELVRTALERTRAVHSKALEWILSHTASDGFTANADTMTTYYRLPWTLAVAGRMDEAAAVLGWIERHALDPSGDLVPSVRRGFVSKVASYPVSQIAIGAQLLERYDLARRVMDSLESRFIDPETGGVFTERPEARKTGQQSLLDTAQAGLAGLATGRLDMARGAVQWLTELWDAQPELPRRLYSSATREGLFADVPVGASSWDVYTDFHVEHQQFYNPGMGAAFLARYSSATGSPEALALARDYLDLTVQGGDLQFDYSVNMQVCKFAWGACAILDIDPSSEILGFVLRMVDWYEDSQRSEGHWYPSSFLVPSPTDGDAMAKTAEHLLHLSTMIRSLGAHLSRISEESKNTAAS